MDAEAYGRGGDRLKDRVAIVTGAGSRADGVGNGRAASILLARNGARVVLVDTNAQWAERTREMIAAEGGDSLVVAQAEGGGCVVRFHAPAGAAPRSSRLAAE
jgi:NAD(P)-dependent dehydrogenase (short-subunit alcohol dehydrogenase family)